LSWVNAGSQEAAHGPEGLQRPGHAARHHTRRERESGEGQVQDLETDPVRQHQTPHRRVRVHVTDHPLLPHSLRRRRLRERASSSSAEIYLLHLTTN